MAGRALLIHVRLLHGRYHGVGDWPPSPFRLFQALVAGAFGGRWTAEDPRAKEAAFEWLEAGPSPPVIAAPKARRGGHTRYYVPNNDLDAVGGDPANVARIRTDKSVTAHHFDRDAGFLYAWSFADGEEHARTLQALAGRLYQLGRGIDPAYVTAEIVDPAEAEARLMAHGGTLHRPANGGQGTVLGCPERGSFASLQQRHRSQLSRLAEGTFRQAPKARSRSVMYDCPPTRLLYELAPADGGRDFEPVPLRRATWLAQAARDVAAARLAGHADPALVERVVTGRGAATADKAVRVRFLPLPSIGHRQADHAVRRLVVDIPPDCPLATADLRWALSGAGLDTVDAQTGEVLADGPRLSPTTDHAMLAHYGVGDGVQARVWRTVTPAVLPASPGRGRQTGRARGAEQARFAGAVHQALRHAGVTADATVRAVQREPFDAKGARADGFDVPERFSARQPRHVEIAFRSPVTGPLIIGDGRYLGLGLMAPVGSDRRDVLVFQIAGDAPVARQSRADLLKAVRRALMALDGDHGGHQGQVCDLFSGHEADGRPARSGVHQHVFLAAAGRPGAGGLDRLYVIAPHRADRRSRPTDLARLMAHFQAVASRLDHVRAGALGVIGLRLLDGPETADPLLARSRSWVSCTPYVPTRHPKRKDDPAGIIADDVVKECRRRGLPAPTVGIGKLTMGRRGGVRADLTLQFPSAVDGPLLLGRDAHAGGGLFVPGP